MKHFKYSCAGIFLAVVFTGTPEALVAQNKVHGAAGTVSGKITVSRNDGLFEEIMQERERNRYADHVHTDAEPEPYSLPEKAVVYLISGAKGPKASPPSVNPRINQKDLMFRPLVLPVVVGTTVDFPNNDEVFHNVFSYSSPKEFDLGRYPIGKSKKVTFDRPGVVNVYCDIHAYMYATILVLENPWFTTPDKDGDYVIRNVPAGEYELAFWYGKKLVSSGQVTVKPGESTHVDLAY